MTDNNQTTQSSISMQNQTVGQSVQNPQAPQTVQTIQPQGVAYDPNQMPSDAFGGNMPYANMPVANNGLPANFAPGNPEAGAMQPDRAKENNLQNEYQAEQQKQPELKAEQLRMIERKEAPKSAYPHNQQSMQQAAQQVGRNPIVAPIQPPKPVGPKFFGYMVSPQIANNFALISNQKGKGSPSKSRTWIYVLLDRMLEKQTNQTKNL